MFVYMYGTGVGVGGGWGGGDGGHPFSEDVPLAEFMCRVFTGVFTGMPGESWRRPLRSLLL